MGGKLCSIKVCVCVCGGPWLHLEMQLACLNNSVGLQGTGAFCSGMSKDCAGSVMRFVWPVDLTSRSHVGRGTCS